MTDVSSRDLRNHTALVHDAEVWTQDADVTRFALVDVDDVLSG